MPKKKIEAAEAATETVVPEKTPDQPKVAIKKHSRLDKVLASDMMKATTKRFGASIIRRASEHHSSKSVFIPSGALALDWVLGGGWRVGGMHTVWGPKSSGKTSSLLLTIGSAQQMCANCWGYATFFDDKTGEVLEEPICPCTKYRECLAAYINNEGTWSETWAQGLGVDTNSLLLSEPAHAEASLDIAEAYIRSGDIDVIAIDSIAFLTPEKEIENSTSKDMMGAQPRVLGKGIRKFVAALNHMGNTTGRKPTIFFTNQVRMKLGIMFGNPETQPGGMAPQFAATTEMKYRTAKYEIEKDEDKEADKVDLTITKPLSVMFSFRNEKNKQGAAMMEGAFRLGLVNDGKYRKGTVCDETIIMDEAEKYEIIKKESSKWSVLGVPFETKKMIHETMVKDTTFKRLLSKRVMECLLAD